MSVAQEHIREHKSIQAGFTVAIRCLEMSMSNHYMEVIYVYAQSSSAAL